MINNASNVLINGLNYLPTAAQAATGVAYGLTGLIVIETAVRLPIDFWKTLQASRADLKESNYATKQELNKVRNNLGADFGHFVFYGLCAASIFPGSLYLGAAIFLASAIIKCENEDAYEATKLVGKPIRWFFKEIVSPIVEAINALFCQVLSGLCNILGDICGNMQDCLIHTFHLIPPMNAGIWCGVVALGVTAIFASIIL